jgi:uncharacterized membrane protein YeaQ/YmgE (transglycosylase-associated protein family)
MGILLWIVFGLIAGVLAKVVMPGRDPGGIIVTILLGIAGAIVGGYLGTLMGYGTVAAFDIRSLAIAIGGALLLLIGYRFVTGTADRVITPPDARSGSGTGRSEPAVVFLCCSPASLLKFHS